MDGDLATREMLHSHLVLGSTESLGEAELVGRAMQSPGAPAECVTSDSTLP